MTQKDKEFLIKDLCARLSYGVKVDCTDGVVQLKSIDFELGSDNPTFWYGGQGTNLTIEDDNIKPYLFPLSSMTEEQKEDMIKSSVGIGSDKNVFDWYNKNHFDYRGLIPMGLAKDASGLNIY